MKKHSLLKVLLITVFVACILTLVIPGTSVDYTGNVTTNGISGVGLYTLLSNLGLTISNFFGIGLLILAIALFYSVLEKVEVYNEFVNKVSAMNTKALVIIPTILFAILAAVVSDFYVLLVFVPFVYKVLSKKEVEKTVILSSTIVPGIIGAMCNIYDSNIISAFNLKFNTLLIAKIVLLVISLVALVLFNVLTSKKSNVSAPVKKEEKEEVKKEVKKAPAKKVVKKETTKKEEKKASAKKEAAKKAAPKKAVAKKAPVKKSTKKSGKKVA